MSTEPGTSPVPAPTSGPSHVSPPSPSPAPSVVPSAGSRIRGCLLGGAIGDSLGYAVESGRISTSVSAVPDRLGRAGLQDLAVLEPGSPFSDDTQMTLYTADGLLEALEWANDGVASDINACLWLAYLRWLGTQGVTAPASAPVQPPRWIDGQDALKGRR